MTYTAEKLLALIGAPPDAPATLNDIACFCESAAVAQGIVAAAVVDTLAPGQAALFLQRLNELAPNVGAADKVAEHFLDCAIEGVSGFVRNQ